MSSDLILFEKTLVHLEMCMNLITLRRSVKVIFLKDQLKHFLGKNNAILSFQ